MSGLRDLSEAEWEAIALETLGELGWQPVAGASVAPGSGERKSWVDLVLYGRLREAVARLNPGLPTHAVEEAVQRVVSAASRDAISENKRIHDILVARDQGLRITYTGADGVEHTPTIRVIDLKNQVNNDYLAVSQVIVKDRDHRRRFDVVLYCNGLPVSVLEVKKAGAEDADLRGAHAQLMRYVAEFPMAFSSVMACVATDGITAAYGTPFTPFEHYAPWNVDDNGNEVREWATREDLLDLPMNLLLHGLFHLGRFPGLLESYVAFAEGKDGLIKRIAKPHQFFAVEKAVDRTLEAVRSHGLAGVVWHTQGSGKSMEMELYTNLVMRHPALGNPTVVVLTDRMDLDDQLWSTFASSELLPEPPVQVATRDELRGALLGRNAGGIIFSTLQKFGKTKAEKEEGVKHPLLSDRHNIIVIVDEAHRSHYDDLDGYARHLRDALPNATMIAFTGTPVSKADRNTREVFGDYIDTYDLSRAVRDGATVPVYYESHLITVGLIGDVDPEEIDERADEAMAGMDDTEKERLRRNVQVLNTVYGADDRIQELAEFVVGHWDERAEQMRKFIGVRGKGMIVCATRDICADLYRRIIAIKPDWHSDRDEEGKIKVVYTGNPAKDSPEVARHVRRPSAVKAIKTRMTDPDDEIELVIVQSMWLTGFDSPPLHTLYLDRPMQGAQLMQTLARVNRTFRGKPAGLLVGTAPIAENLMAAIAEYSADDRQNRPLGKDLDRAIDEVKNLHDVIGNGILHGYDWRAKLKSPSPHAFIHAVTGAVNYLRDPRHLVVEEGVDPLPKRFRAASGKLERLYALCSRATDLSGYRDDIAYFVAVRVWMAKFDAEERRARGLPIPKDVELYLRRLTQESIESDGIIDIYGAAGIEKPDLSNLSEDFLQRMRDARNPNLAIEALRRVIEGKMREVTRHNLVRQQSFSDRLLELMRRYTNQNLTAAEIIDALVKMAKEISAEANRGKDFSPPLNSNELAFYDAVAANQSALDVMGNDTLADIARDLVRIVQRDAKTDWVYRDDVRAKLRATIKLLLARHGYPPDAQPDAIKRVLEQMETYADEWARDRASDEDEES
ncbi:type I restriction endonuclease subunit R [Actinocorallia populi]|uniref:type I restriction endonuclease subunit R n=1 Tax=Actinocorallia populi TaxID=2079200 RepID=UPI000D092368|nr:type I restriction endonuclease subunit R [Actinocorallia populi]